MRRSLRISSRGIDKESRLAAQAHKFETGSVRLPRQAPWLGTYVTELLAFPNAAHDDQVDSTSQALKYLSRHMERTPKAVTKEGRRARPQSRIGAR